MPLTTTAAAISGGADALDGRGNDWAFAVSYTPVLGDLVTLELTDTLTGIQTQVGAGYASAVVPTYAFTFNNRVFTLGSSPFIASSAFYSALTFPTVWNNPNAAGNGFTTMKTAARRARRGNGRRLQLWDGARHYLSVLNDKLTEMNISN